MKYQIEINNIAFLPKDTQVDVSITGVRNPSIGTISSGWSVASLLGINKIDESASFRTFNYKTKYSPSFITFYKI